MGDPSPTILYLLRHAEVEEKYHKAFGGHIDMELSPLGHEQAAALAKYLRGHSFNAIYSSPMRRVQQTLQALVRDHDMKPVFMEGLREVNFGVWSGLKWHEVQEQHGKSAFDWLRHIEAGEIEEAETGASFRARVEPCLRDILNRHSGETIAIACHGGVVRMILSLLLDLPWPRTNVFDVEYASMTRLECHAHKTEIQLLNFTPWRDLK